MRHLCSTSHRNASTLFVSHKSIMRKAKIDVLCQFISSFYHSMKIQLIINVFSMTNESSFSDFTIELSSFIEFSCQTCFQIRFLTSDIVDSILFCFTRQRFNFMLSFQSNSKHDRSNIESLDCDVFIDRSH